jgi:hypothetical protein
LTIDIFWSSAPIVELASESDRSWLLAQVQRNLDDADLPYVAGSHSLE